ncbi:hypothetical protein BJ742DRAFT_18198, partial [Cladochytrium replicatum]
WDGRPLAGLLDSLDVDVDRRLSTAHFSTAPGVESKISESEYHKLADETLDVLVTFFEDLGDELDLDGYDVSYSNGVVTLKLGEPGTYVINKQPPNLQIWLSSPVSGPKRFDFVDGDWIYKRENESLQSLLTSEVSKALNRKISVPSSH